MKRKFLTFAFILIGLFLASCGGRQVTINFDVQGGVPISAIEITQLTEIEEPTPVREGYTFLGWYTEETYENLFDFEEGATRNITLYAQWEINEYTISFETYNDTTIDPITANYQTTISIPSNLVKEGFTFGGWYQDAEFTTRFEGTRMGASDLTLHAYWAPIYYTVEFYADSELVDTVPVQHGELIEDIPAIPIKEGYDSSWDFNENTRITSNMTINAIYVLKTYTVTFVDQTGNLYHTETVNHGEKAIGPETDPSKLGYTFVGYSEDLSTFIVEEDTEITVLFSPVAYLVTFRVQGMQVKSEEVIYGQDATPPTVTVDGYTFVEWDVDFTNVTSNLEVNAILEANNYNITLHGNGGVFAGEETTDIVSAPYESSVNYSTQPTRLGYQFGGWYLNAEGTGNPINLVNYTMPLNGVELYAKWNLVTYTITYNDLFGSQTSNRTSYNVTNSFTLTNPTSRIGYSFVGWFDAQTDGNQVTTIDAGTTGNLSLYARWLANEYTITYENLFTQTHSNPANYTIETPTITLTDPTLRTGYTFVG
ncbi:MAG: InlB B-repeat-containing protein, partial [Candidatus Izemoplasmatales bacterium]|nr:InlB B-repeat-containing protein [Candidatus Izemoplasmatales bacterium]